ncbi:RNA-directed DNA polymerase from mobile element jockey, partial [Paramuricea clavata]
MWKFVDDVSSSENLTSNSFSVTQSTLDSIDSWATYNCMKLNAKKCKELRVSFLKETPQLPSLTIDGYVVETVQSHKVLGLIIQNNLKWDEQIRSIVTKASKRLYGLRVLCRGGVPPADLTNIYFALIRSILEYCCEVWNYAIPRYLSDELERVQKRAMRIIFPGHPYDEALQLANCTRLSDRRNETCINTLQKIAKRAVRSNFEDVLPQIEKALQESEFVAIDTEFTGLAVNESQRPSLFDTPCERYMKLKRMVGQFLVCQFGISAFIKSQEYPNTYEARTFNFHLFPSSFGQIDVRFTCQASSLEFLCNHKFDFNKFVYEGISFLNKNQEHLKDLKTKQQQEKELITTSVQSRPSNNKRLYHAFKTVRIDVYENGDAERRYVNVCGSSVME